MFRSPKLQRQRQQLLLLGVAACVVLFALKSTNCTPQTTAVCRDHGDEGSMRQGGEHVVCIYQDRVIKTVKTCSKKKWPHTAAWLLHGCAACGHRVSLRVRMGGGAEQPHPLAVALAHPLELAVRCTPHDGQRRAALHEEFGHEVHAVSLAPLPCCAAKLQPPERG